MNDKENNSAGWGDSESVVDESFNRRSFFNMFATLGIVLLVIAVGIGILFKRQYERQKTASVEANGEMISKGIVKRVRAMGVPIGTAIRDDSNRPLLSWRVSLLPYIKQRKLIDEFDFKSTWDSDANLPLSEMVIPTYQSDRATRRTPACTNWVAVVGKETVIRDHRPNRNEYAGVRTQVAFIELPNSDIPWTEPRDVTVEEAIKLIRSSHEFGGLFCGTGDGRVIRIHPNIGEEELSRLLGE